MAGFRTRVADLAARYGWSFAIVGGHGRLTKPGYPPIPCSGTPTNTDLALREIERDIRRRERNHADTREAP